MRRHETATIDSPLHLGPHFRDARPGSLVRRSAAVVQHARLRRDARARADGDQILQPREDLADVVKLGSQVRAARGGAAGDHQHVERGVVGIGVGGHDSREEGRIEGVHGSADGLGRHGFERAPKQGQLEVRLPRERL